MSTLLCEKLGTKFVIDKLDMHLLKSLEELKNSNEDVDLAYCRFGPKAERVLARYYGTIHFINTENSEWDAILKHNWDVIHNPEEEWPVLDLAGRFTLDNLIDEIYAIPTGNYKLKVNLSSMLEKCAAILLILARPDIDFDLESCMHDIATIAASRIHIDDFAEDEVYVVETPYIFKMKKEDVMYTDKLIIPCSFGRDKIVSFVEEIDRRPEYDDLVKYVIGIIQECFTEKKVEEVDITRYLQFREK